MPRHLTRLSDKKIASVRKKNGKRFVMGIVSESTVISSQKWPGHKNTTLVYVTCWMIRAFLNFKHQFNNIYYRLSL